jgi:NAD(P)H-nitrite reductase large subunit
MGQVAKEYNLYTKITGGQRIDLFGAERHELPDIWYVSLNILLTQYHKALINLIRVHCTLLNTYLYRILLNYA